MNKVGEEFFDCDCEELAKKLLGKTLCINHNDETIKRIITETEAYGINDSACHCYKGRTKRNDPMFKKGGTVYVYLCYGLHEILNFSSGKDGEGQGVMIRGIDNIFGPGKVSKSIKIDRSFNYEFLPTSEKIWLEDGVTVKETDIDELKRVGIGYATQYDQDRLWRFNIKP